MQTCSHCGADQLDGTIFCEECGGSLLVTASRKEITASLSQHFDQDPQPTIIPEPVAPSSSGYLLSLVVLNSGRRLDLDASEEMLIGRKDNARGIYPDVDLGLYGGYDAGVSRRHAIIAMENGVCVVQDLESANGTFVNGQRVSPQVPTPLRHGDELKFGTLLLRIEMAGV